MSMTWMTVAAWLAHSAVGGALLLWLTWGLVRRTRQPVRRQRLAEWGVTAALVVAGLSWAPAWLVLDWACVSAPPVKAVPDPVPVLTQLPALELEPLVESEEAEPKDAEVVAVAPPIAPPLPKPEPPVMPAPEPPAWNAADYLAALTPWLVAVYGALASWFCGRWLLGHFALARLLRATEPVPKHIAELFATLTPGKRRPRLLMSRRLRVPISCGLWRPTIVLPAALCGCPEPRKLRWVFVHELTHLERRDAWSGLLFGLAQPLYFFVPCFWWLRRQVRLCQEYIADAASVVDQPRQAADYAEFLLSLVTAPAVPRAATGVSGQSSDLYRRVTMLLQEPLRVEKRCPRRWSLTAAASLLTLAVVLAGVGWRTEAAPAASPAADDVIIIIKTDGTGKPEAQVRVVKVADPQAPQAGKVLIQQFPSENKVLIKQFAPAENKIFLHTKDGNVYWKKADAQLEELRAALKLIEQQGNQVDAKEIRRIILKALEKIDGKAQPVEWQVVPVQPPKVKIVTPQSVLPPQMVPFRLKIEGMPGVQHWQPLVPGDKTKPAPQAKEKAKAHWEIELLVPKDMNYKQLQELLEKFATVKQQQLAQDQVQKALVAERKARMALEQMQAELKAQVELEKMRAVEAALQADLLAKQERLAREQALKALDAERKARTEKVASKTVLGLQVDPPSDALADQLNLPKHLGLVVSAVVKESPAAKAGFKVNDVLLAVAGKKVPSDLKAIQEIIHGLKPGATFDVTVVRKGVETHLKVTLVAEPILRLNLKVPPTNKQVTVGKDKVVVTTNEKNVLTTTFRAEDRFTTRHQEGSLIITVTGKITDKKAHVGEIHIQDGTVVSKFTNTAQVPVQYRDKVHHLLQLSAQRATEPLPEASLTTPPKQ